MNFLNPVKKKKRNVPIGLLVLALVWLGGCEADGLKPDAHDPGHGEHERPDAVYTHFIHNSELFVEFPVLVKGEQSPFVAHFTRLPDYTAVAQGKASVILTGGGHPDERFSVNEVSIPGIFRPVAVPRYSGQRALAIELQSGNETARHELGPVQVHASLDTANGAQPMRDDHEGISFLKEQQWRVDFGIARVAKHELRASIAANAVLRPRTNGEAHITAPTAGRLLSAKETLPALGSEVQEGSVLARIAPRLSGEVDIASLQAAMERQRNALEVARKELERVENLYQQGAVSERRLQQAEAEFNTVRAEFNAAKQRLERYGRASTDIDSAVSVPAPISGTLDRIHVVPGTYLNEGQPLFHIINLDRLWLEARIPEVDIGRLGKPSGAWFELPDGQRVEIDTQRDARLISFGTVVHETNRTLPLVFEFTNTQPRLRANTYVRAHVFTGEEKQVIAVPASSVIDVGGQFVVFVMRGGETFERRPVQVGIRDKDWVEIVDGVQPDERVVSRGAYLVHLAASAPAEIGHGHHH